MENGEKILFKSMQEAISKQATVMENGFDKVHKRINDVNRIQAQLEAKQSAMNVMMGTIKDVVTKHTEDDSIHFKKELVSDHIACREVHFTQQDFREEEKRRRRETMVFFASLFVAYGGITIWFLNMAKQAFLK